MPLQPIKALLKLHDIIKYVLLKTTANQNLFVLYMCINTCIFFPHIPYDSVARVNKWTYPLKMYEPSNFNACTHVSCYRLIGGGGESCSHITEGLSTALHVFDDLQKVRIDIGWECFSSAVCQLFFIHPTFFIPLWLQWTMN